MTNNKNCITFVQILSIRTRDDQYGRRLPERKQSGTGVHTLHEIHDVRFSLRRFNNIVKKTKTNKSSI